MNRWNQWKMTEIEDKEREMREKMIRRAPGDGNSEEQGEKKENRNPESFLFFFRGPGGVTMSGPGLYINTHSDQSPRLL